LVRVELRAGPDGRLTLVVADNGVGLPPEFDMLNTDSLGLHLVRILVQQLDGTLEVQGQGGTQFRITFIVP
jgi:two-component sensor histidine kinase